MPLYEWTPSCSVRVKEFDKQHQRLFGMINDLNAAMQARRGRAAIGTILAGLTAYAEEHFTAEETAMRRTSYPKVAEHHEEHQDFTKHISEFLAEYQSGNTLISISVLRFLNDWLQNHILRSDQEYAAHMNEHGIY